MAHKVHITLTLVAVIANTGTNIAKTTDNTLHSLIYDKTTPYINGP